MCKSLLNTQKMIILKLQCGENNDIIISSQYFKSLGSDSKIATSCDVNIPNPVGKTKKYLPNSRSINTGKSRCREESMRDYKPRNR